MTCSKTFTGDIPELTYDILKYLHDDYSTLHSCDLVDRLWCRLAIPLLWENPFSIATGNRNFIEIYLRNLDGDLKTRLNEYEINDNSLFSNTLFNYPRFLKYLNTDKILCSVWKWFDYSSKRGNKDSFSSMCSVSDFGKLIYTSIFNENEVVLHIFEIDISDTNNKYYGTYYDNIFELILQNKNFFRNIKYLNLYIDDSYEDDLGDNTDSYTLIKNRMLQIINLHQNLKKLLIDNNNLSLYQSLLLSKVSNFSNTLNTIILFYVDFKNMVIGQSS